MDEVPRLSYDVEHVPGETALHNGQILDSDREPVTVPL